MPLSVLSYLPQGSPQIHLVPPLSLESDSPLIYTTVNPD